MPYRPRTLTAALLVGALLLLPACDTVDLGNGETVLLTRQVTFDFDFQQSGAQDSRRVTSSNSIDLTGQLEGFLKSEILSATVTAVTLRRDQPVGRDLSSLMSGVEVELTASGASAATVARATTLPASNQASLTTTSASVTAQTRADRFGAALTFTDLAAPPGGVYGFTLTVTLRVEVEGV